MSNKLGSNKIWLTSLILASFVLAGLPAGAQQWASEERCAPLTDPDAELTTEEFAALEKYCNTPPTFAPDLLNALAAPVVSTVTQLFDFEDGAQGWTFAGDSSTSLGYPSTSPNWILSTSMDDLDLVSSWWTNTNDGRLGAERSHVTSPVLTASGTSVSINFDSWSKNEGGYPTYYDVEHVQISINSGAFTDVHGYTSQLHSFFGGSTRNITFTTTGITSGDQIQYRFLYDTGDGCCGYWAPGRGWAFDNVLVTGASEMIPVTIDIKPGSDENSINLCSNGAVPVAILGSDTFDVNDINPDTLRLADAAVKIVGKKDPKTLCSIEDMNADSYDDLVCHFNTTELSNILDGTATSATVKGETVDGTPIEGSDNITIVKDECE